jgi:regulatory protein
MRPNHKDQALARMEQEIRELEQSGESTSSGKLGENEQRAIRKAMNLLLYKDRTEKELSDRLAHEEFEPDAVWAAMQYVKSFGYINDERYAENYLISFSGKKSRRAIHQELLRKGVDETVIETVMEEAPEDELPQITRLLEKKAGEPHVLDDKEKRRAVAYLSRRGFTGSDIWKAIRAYEQTSEE